MKPQPIVFRWQEADVIDGDGEVFRRMVMVPNRRYADVAKRQFALNEEYPLAIIEQRSMASHNHFFAALHQYWLNLPETISERWPTEAHFRSWLLIETGWFTEKEFGLATEKHAKALATFIRTEDCYARILVRGLKVIVRQARSQSLATMGKADFEASKKAVLELAEHFVGVAPGKMAREAARIA